MNWKDWEYQMWELYCEGVKKKQIKEEFYVWHNKESIRNLIKLTT